MSFELTTNVTSLLYAPLSEPVTVTFIGFDSVRERCRAVGVAEGTSLAVRGRADEYLLVEVEAREVVMVDAVTARFVQVSDPDEPTTVS